MSVVEIVIRTIDQSSAGIEKTKGGLAKLASQFLSVASAVGILESGTRALITYFKESVQAAAESERVQAQLEQVIKSTGGAAGVTAEQVSNMANSMSRLTAIDDDVIKKTDAVLLTFTNIGRDALPGATMAVLDMATAMGTDFQSAALQVGKALNGTANGVTALSRSGVSFTDDQKKLIKTLFETNRAAEAQQIIIAELNKEFGGQAAAAANTYAGAQERLNNALENRKEIVGERLLQLHKDFNTQQAEAVEKSNDLQQALVYTNKTFEQFTRAAKYSGVSLDEYVQATLAGYRAAEDSVEATNQQANSLAGVAISAEEAQAALEELEKTNAANIDAMINLTDISRDFSTSQGDIKEQQGEIKAEIDKLIAQGWWPLSDKVKGLQEDYDKLGEKYTENAAAHQARLVSILTDMTLEKIAMQDGVAGFSDAEAAKALAVAQTTGLVDSEAIKQQVAFDQVSTAIANGTVKVEDFKKLLEEMTQHEWTIDVALNMLQRGYAGYGYGLSYATGDLQHQNQRAAGGPVFSWTPYVVGERGPELFVPGTNGTIVPNDKLGGGTDQVALAAAITSRMPTERGIAKALARELDARGLARR